MPKSGKIFRFAVYYQQALDRMIRLTLQHANPLPLRNHTVGHRTMSRTRGHVAMRSLLAYWTGFGYDDVLQLLSHASESRR